MHGNAIPSQGFSNDDGSADPGVGRALAAFQLGGIGTSELVAALGGCRLIVPVVTTLQDEPPASPSDATRAKARDSHREKEAEISLILIKAPDGRTALPAFTSVEALARWKADARPVPAEAQRVCAGALAEGADLVVVDPSGPITVELAGSVLWALADGRSLVSPAADPQVVDAVRKATAGKADAFADVYIHPGQPQDTDLVISLVARDGSGRDELRKSAEEIASVLAADPIMRSRVDHGVQIAVVPTPPGGGIRAWPSGLPSTTG